MSQLLTSGGQSIGVSASISQDTDQVVWYSNLFKNFPQFVVIDTVKGFDVVN